METVLDVDYFILILIFCLARLDLIGNQLIGTAQIKRVRLRHGSNTSYGNEVIFIAPHKGIHGDENNVCL